MNLKTQFQRFPVTFVLLVICIGVFVVQVFSGVNPASPSNKDLVAWGANWLFLTLGGEWWRAVTAIFLHVGFMHLAFNTYALYLFGQVSENIFGRWYYLCLFMLAGLGGNLLNSAYTLSTLTADSLPAVSAGASGGIMGLGGALFMLALLKVPVRGAVLNFKALAWIMGINLAMGFAIPGIDNAAHIGGMLTGALLATVYATTTKAPKAQNAIKLFAVLVVGAVFVAVFYGLTEQLVVRATELGFFHG